MLRSERKNASGARKRGRTARRRNDSSPRSLSGGRRKAPFPWRGDGTPEFIKRRPACEGSFSYAMERVPHILWTTNAVKERGAACNPSGEETFFGASPGNGEIGPGCKHKRKWG